MYIIISSVILSIMTAILTFKSIPKLSSLFTQAGLYGKDLCKKNSSEKIPEAQGLICGTIFLMSMFVFLGIRFGKHFILKDNFPHLEFSQLLTSLLSICCMLLLGFADDVLNLKWRYKLLFPMIASVPLLMVYYINEGSTTIIVPKLFRAYAGLSVDIGPLYYLFMSLLAVFCTNAINIYAGVNGLESGQALLISLSVAVFNVIELQGFQASTHAFSLSIMLPFAATCAALYYYNKYPARVFVGDTFTYFAGMTFAVTGIVGHFSKTLLLFFIPQVFNFIYSTPQLFKLIPCPRHRLPRYNESLDCLEFSETTFKRDAVPPVVLMGLSLLHRLRLVNFSEGDGDTLCRLNNLTLINLFLVWFGPMRERSLVNALLVLQIAASVVALFIRYPFASLFYD